MLPKNIYFNGTVENRDNLYILRNNNKKLFIYEISTNNIRSGKTVNLHLISGKPDLFIKIKIKKILPVNG